ncbi:hypothetical protein [Flavobacterium crassostreae]|uniref:Major facilitator superfamily (MFS) profile domain-containing protein n=1 Tax=Flavobacterium crassostreae TaxID=1763534 RepID=A0A1B9DZT6_9FLAO|nr:hypothetical protein [Flavobacterium crassostreae]OCB75200.1 hypothetical protein LPBF_09075 [Flavobacterium crassostreae]
MNKKELLYGFLLGVLGTLLGSYLFVTLFTEYSFWIGFQIMKSQGALGKLITLGSIPNLVLFAVLLRLNKEQRARGVVFALLAITLITVLL